MIKCIVWDLDNTIWDGIIDENKPISKLKPQIDRILKCAYEAGIINAIVSKNQENEAKNLMSKLGILEYFTCYEIGWKQKHSSILKISKNLNIGVDTILFIDDSQFELDEVKFFLPQVQVMHAEKYLSLYDMIKKAKGKTRESKRRNIIYKILKKRNHDEKTFAGSREDFLKSCNIKISFRNATKLDVDRIFELSQRTNQFNLTHNRLSEMDIYNILDNPNYLIKICELQDKYADYGIVGAVIGNVVETFIIEEFNVSCKIEGRGVGKCFLSFIINENIQNGITEIFSKRNFNDKNIEIQYLYNNLGFKEYPADGDLLIRDSNNLITYDPWMQISIAESDDVSKIRNILQFIIGDIKVIDNDSNLLESNIIDSISAISLISAIEKEFNIEIEFDDLNLDNFKSVNSIIGFINMKRDDIHGISANN